MLEVRTQNTYPPVLRDTETGEEWVLQSSNEIALAKLVVKAWVLSEENLGRIKYLEKRIQELENKDVQNDS